MEIKDRVKKLSWLFQYINFLKSINNILSYYFHNGDVKPKAKQVSLFIYLLLKTGNKHAQQTS